MESAKWLGKCPSCGEWNTFVEEVITKEPEKTSWKKAAGGKPTSQPVTLSEISANSQARVITPDKEFNRVLGGGIVSGSVVLVGGEPGIGKSTLMLQIGLGLNGQKVLYVSGEESEEQIKMRAERMNMTSENCFILSETSTQAIFRHIEKLKPDIVIVDSVQTLASPLVESTPGSVSQVRESAGELMKYAKESGSSVILIGHITKEGSLAGPKVLEHMVDTVLQFEGDRHLSYRILRTIKNRFGSTSELGIYEMSGKGMIPVDNPSEILISQRDEPLSGVTIGATLEGNRPMLIEVQSLVSPATYGTPQRSPTGFDLKRLNMLLAVLEKRGGLRLGAQDVFVNIAGGIRVQDPAIDLALCVSLVSSYNEIPVPGNICFAAEIGLGGEIRAVNRIEDRIREAEKLGFEQIYVSGYNRKGLDRPQKIQVKAFSKLQAVTSSLT